MSDTDATLVRMANQIGAFFAHQRHEDAALGVADHLLAFWDPNMRRRLLALDDRGGGGGDLLPPVRAAVAIVRQRSSRSIETALATGSATPIMTGSGSGSDAG